MVPETLNLRARWGTRQETVGDCAKKMFAFLNDLAKCDDIFAQPWLKSSGTNLQDVEVSVESLQSLLEKGRVRRDFGKSIVEHLGYDSSRLWNGSKNNCVFVFVQCGAYPNPQVLPSANCVWLDLPDDNLTTKWVARPQQLLEITNVVVKNWDPDWARISTNKIDAEIYRANPYRGQMVGWLTYISERYGPLPSLPKECSTERVGELGTLISITSINERLTISNPAHVALVRQLSEVLEQAGVLAPIPPTNLNV